MIDKAGETVKALYGGGPTATDEIDLEIAAVEEATLLAGHIRAALGEERMERLLNHGLRIVGLCIGLEREQTETAVGDGVDIDGRV